ncbi:DUF3168 domain-containing protein [Rudanella paleaurantiibacter]|uniref:DUF3168 domain-containing protein n=1 Tax=Rudanella paleaurantiibacter TaxID=2614655 RepID=A0A7J5TYB2_9BACT|nr:DUF3168 domain-containing protein [Rudanella paleaurantiibacter]KAB7730139.1 DUF3168 domain-containing protein [Rudanella paleaurantiibacter]
MTDAGFALAAAYATLLGGLTYNGKSVVLYSLQAPDNAVAPYIILGPWVSVPAGTKDSFGQTGEITLDVVTRFTGPVSKKPATDIANLATALITPSPGKTGLSVAGFNVVRVQVVGTRDMPQLLDTDTVVRKIITVSHTLNQV